MKDIFYFENENDLQKVIENLKVKINKRREGREQSSLDLWVLKHYLPTITNEIDFPVRIYQAEESEFPDFVLETNNTKFGIEITEATSEDYQKLLSLMSKTPNSMIDLGHFDYRKSYNNEYTFEELKKMIKPKGSKLGGYGYNGYICERYISIYSKDAAKNKVDIIMTWNKPYPVRIVLYENTPKVDCHFNKLIDYLNENIINNDELNNYRVDIVMSNGATILKSIYNFAKSE
jgi:hypothetical protein